MIGGIRFCGCGLDYPFVCFGAKPTERACALGSRQLGPVNLEACSANLKTWVNIPGVFVGISLEYTLALTHIFTESYTKVSQTSPFLRLELIQVRVCSLFFHPLGCVCYILCVRKEMWYTPSRRWEKPLEDLKALSGLGGWDSGNLSAVYCHKIAL